MIRTAIFIIALLFALSAESHDWYDGSCCNEQDCRQTVLKEVERRPGGWYINVTDELIPFEDKRIRRSLDPLIHICLMSNWVDGVKMGQKARCLYVPEVAG